MSQLSSSFCEKCQLMHPYLLWNLRIKHSMHRKQPGWSTNMGNLFCWLYEYKTDFNLNECKGFTNDTKKLFMQNKSLLHMQKHKGSNSTVWLHKETCFMLEQIILLHIINCSRWTRILLFNFFNFFLLILTTLSTHFKMFLKRFKNISWLLYCMIWNVYHNFTETSISVGQSKHDTFYFFGEKLLEASVVKVLAAILSPVCCINVHWFLLQFEHFLCAICSHHVQFFFLLKWNDSGAPNYKTILTTTIFIHFKKLVSNFVKIATMLQN